MKTMLFTLTLALALTAGAAAQEYEVGLTGMTWGATCSKAVRATIENLAGVDQVKVECSKGLTLVTMKNTRLSESALKVAFKGSKYGVKSFKEITRVAKSYTLNISGMTWGSCPTNVREALSKMEGVAKVDVDSKKKTAMITMKPGSALTQETAGATLKKSKRYGVTSFVENKPKAKKSGQVKVGLTGMTWGGCEKSVRGTLSKLAGVKSVTADSKTQTVIITLNERAVLAKETVETAFKGSKYKVTAFETM